MTEAFYFVKCAILSCKTIKQMKVAKKLIDQFHLLYKIEGLRDDLLSIYNRKSDEFIWYEKERT